MKLIKIKLFHIEYHGNYGLTSVLIEAENFTEAEKLFNMQYNNRFTISKISIYNMEVFRKSIKLNNIEV